MGASRLVTLFRWQQKLPSRPCGQAREEVTPSGPGIRNKQKSHLGPEGRGTASSSAGCLQSLSPFCSVCWRPETLPLDWPVTAFCMDLYEQSADGESFHLGTYFQKSMPELQDIATSFN